MIFNCSPSEFKKISEFTLTTQIGDTPTGEYVVTDSLNIKGTYGVGVSVSENTLQIGIDEATFPKGLLHEGGGSGLPEVGEAYNGKILMVVGGKWAIVDFPSGAGDIATAYNEETGELTILHDAAIYSEATGELTI